MAEVVSLGPVSQGPSDGPRDSLAYAPSGHRRNRSAGSGSRHSLRRSRSSLESIHKKRAQQEQLDSARLQPKSGQQFRVGNVTSNGRLQLRPVARENNPYSSPPLTPPYNNTTTHGARYEVPGDWGESMFSRSIDGPSTTDRGIASQRPNSFSIPPSRARSHSFSTMDDPVELGRRNATNVRVLINRTSPTQTQPRTATDRSLDLLEISIPHYRLGTPHFTGKGSAILHSSINTGSSITDGIRSSAFSGQEYDRMFPQPPGAYQRLSTNMGAGASKAHYLSVDGAASQRRTVSTNMMSSHTPRGMPVESTVLLELEASPLNQNSRSLVRLSRTSGQILAATPSGLIAQITSPNLLDYELLSDFFLTFRSYLTTQQLVGFLITRLQWAVSRSDDFGRIVRVRTFVALRHWILNYFVDDFVADYGLRSEFCNLVNDLCDELQARHDGGVGDLKILGELKKCWRRTCALYWDVPEHKSERPVDPVLPGGRLGSRNLSNGDDLNQAVLGDGAPQGSEYIETANVKSPGGPAENQTSSMLQGKAIITHHPPNRTSDQSTHVVSCSITFKSMANPGNKAERSIGARPAAPAQGSAPTSARLSPALRKNSPPYHRRTGSFSDALRDSRANILETSVRRPDLAATTTHPFSGSLVRGALIRPGSPYVDSVAPASPVDEKSLFDFNFAGQDEVTNLEDRQQTATSPGMKKFLGNVRRALSTRQNTSQANMIDRKAVNARRSPRMSTLPISVPSSSVLPGTPKRRLVGGQTQPRVDLLVVAASESFYKIAKEEANADGCDHLAEITAQSGQMVPNPSGLRHLSTSAPAEGNRMHSDVTMGSRSIVIVDDTGDYLTDSRPLTQGSRAENSLVVNSDRTHSRGDRETIAIGVEPESPMANKLLELGIAGIVTPPPSSASPNSQAMQVEVADTGRKSKLQPSLHEVTATTENTRDTQTTTADAFHYDRQPQLRRRPGGDLRAVDHVHSLGESTSHRSLGSDTTDSQVLLGLAQSGVTSEEQPMTVPEEPQTRKSVSVIDTHSSQPVLRPSFEQEVAKLAQLPDDEDDGGIESTLRKLEGQLQASDSGPFDDEPPVLPGTREIAQNIQGASTVTGSNTSQGIAQHSHREEEVYGGVVTHATAAYEEGTAVGDFNRTRSSAADVELDRAPSVASAADSDASYSSTPLLERGVSFVPSKKRHSSSDWLKVSLPKSAANSPLEEPAPFQMLGNQADKMPRVQSVDSLEQITRQTNLPRSSEAHESFLLNDNQSLTDVALGSNGAQIQPVDPENPPRSFLYDDNDDTPSTNGDHVVLPHPLRHPATPLREKSSPFALHQSAVIPGPSLAGHLTQQDRDAFKSRLSHSQLAQSKNAIELEAVPARPTFSTIPGAAHMPFILGFDSLLLAQQFTLIEKDALSEIGWRQLIDLRWNTNAKTCRTWADCLKPRMNGNKEQRFLGGVDICITRFNIVVKWAASEIVLCQDMADRVACIVKYIHIALHARQLRNWATMFQITMALVSADVSRLKDTWLEVPFKEREHLKTLETLIMPTRNFHNLREEMEKAIAGPPAPGTDGGCIPFIGIYTHDLIYNSQKPEFAQQPEGIDNSEPLVNFERHRTAATIVKSLLRLIDASSKYPFQPVTDVLSRCLWMATLEDEEISRRSKTLES